jgi:hypothetical protein
VGLHGRPWGREETHHASTSPILPTTRRGERGKGWKGGPLRSPKGIGNYAPDKRLVGASGVRGGRVGLHGRPWGGVGHIHQRANIYGLHTNDCQKITQPKIPCHPNSPPIVILSASEGSRLPACISHLPVSAHRQLSYTTLPLSLALSRTD